MQHAEISDNHVAILADGDHAVSRKHEPHAAQGCRVDTYFVHQIFGGQVPDKYFAVWRARYYVYLVATTSVWNNIRNKLSQICNSFFYYAMKFISAKISQK